MKKNEKIVDKIKTTKSLKVLAKKTKKVTSKTKVTKAVKTTKVSKKVLNWFEKYLRYTDYLAVAQLYLKENILQDTEITQENIKTRILGHWGTVPGLNFIYANLNYLVYKENCEILFVTGPGHGAPAILANVFAEETLGEFYPDMKRNKKGMQKLAHDFSWPHSKFPSHVTPTVPGSILEGGELGYSLSTAFGAALDNPNLIVAAVVGDGESETGPLSAAWHSNKFLNPKTSGAVLPIVHVNGYKISNPTILASMSNKELKNMYSGFGYEPLVVEGSDLTKMTEKMIGTLNYAYKKIRQIQKDARENDKIEKPQWPMIIFKSPKGWRGIKTFEGTPIENSFHSHGIPIGNPKAKDNEFKAVKTWLESYKIKELIDEEGQPKKEVIEYIPKGKARIGKVKYAFGGDIYKKLKIPALSKYGVAPKSLAGASESNMMNLGDFLGGVFKANKKNFRVMCPDELLSNKLDGIFKETQRAFVWTLKENDELMAKDGRAMEILSEHTLQGWMQGYLLTGRHALFASYEAFTPIISTMVDQHAKFIKQSLKVKWRRPVASAIYLETSLGWRQEHNGYSHQNPSFLSNVLLKHGDICKAYFPADTNSLLVAFEEMMKSQDSINVVIAGKRKLPQYLSLKEAKAQAREGVAIWEFVSNKAASKKPDVILASTGDYLTQEAIEAVKICKELIPELNIRYVNVSKLTEKSIGDNAGSTAKNKKKFEQYFTKDKHVVFAYHGYANDISRILWPYTTSDRVTIHGYEETGSTTTPFDLKISNHISRYHLAIDMIENGAKENKAVKSKAGRTIRKIKQKIKDHQSYIEKYGDDPKEVS